ncbi:hypothetical protein ABZX85_48920 [Streptomyces sp. NPDC004539]|uniref:hypothetical protein n=1 Tax=Streptomyces sp. NPDC004539 TaxID=3154280 RepID=UPI0033AB3434
MNRSWGVRLSMTAAASALSLAFITGCSSDSDSGDKSEDTADTKASPTAPVAPAGKASTAAELKKLLLVAGDVTGYATDGSEALLPKSKDQGKVDKTECSPLLWSTLGLPPGDTTVSANTALKEEKKAGGSGELSATAALANTRTLIGLSSYEGDGATKAMKAVSDSITACSGGFTSTDADGEPTKITKVTAEKGTGGGDEALAFVEAVDIEGTTVPVHGEVIRKGNTVATFYSLNLAAFAGQGESPKNPPALITAQLAKLK